MSLVCSAGDIDDGYSIKPSLICRFLKSPRSFLWPTHSFFHFFTLSLKLLYVVSSSLYRHLIIATSPPHCVAPPAPRHCDTIVLPDHLPVPPSPCAATLLHSTPHCSTPYSSSPPYVAIIASLLSLHSPFPFTIIATTMSSQSSHLLCAFLSLSTTVNVVPRMKPLCAQTAASTATLHVGNTSKRRQQHLWTTSATPSANLVSPATPL